MTSKRPMVGVVGAAAVAVMLLATPGTSRSGDDAWGGGFGWDEEPAAAPEVDLWEDASAADGKHLYRTLCSGCHGVDGAGDGVAAPTMFPPPRDLTLGVYRFRTTPSGTLPTREDLLRTVRDGLPGTEMPSWGPQLKDEQLRSLVLFVQELSPRFKTDPAGPEDVLVDMAALVAPEATPELVERGRGVYEAMKCSACHGETGRGDGEAAAQYGRGSGTDTEVFDFTWGVYKGGASAESLYRTFVTGLDGTPMPSYVDSLPDDEDRWALALYCLSLTRKRGLPFYLAERPTWYEPAAPPPKRVDSGPSDEDQGADEAAVLPQ